MDAIIDENKKSWLQRFILWREKKIKEKHFILILSFLAGIFTALAAWFLKFLVEWIKEFLTENFDSTGVNWLYLVYPVFGIFLTGLFIRYIVKDDISHGVTKILYAISRRQSRIKRHNTWSSVIASAITIGFGGSVGAEAPIVLTGSAIGSNFGALKIPAMAPAAPQPTSNINVRCSILNTLPRLEPIAEPVSTIGASAPTDPPNPMVMALAIVDDQILCRLIRPCLREMAYRILVTP